MMSQLALFMITFVLGVPSHAQTPALTTAPVAEKEPPPPEVDPDLMEKVEKLCALTEACNKNHLGVATACVKVNLKKSGLLKHELGGEEAKELPRFLRREGFIDVEIDLKDFSLLRDGSLLVLDAHDPVRDHKPTCPQMYGNIFVKCGNHWIDSAKQALDFHMQRGCRTKGIWTLPGLKPQRPKPEKFK